jgi:hypothetical protein
VVTIVTDISFGLAARSAPSGSRRSPPATPELAHVRTRVKTPGQNGSGERGLQHPGGTSRLRGKVRAAVHRRDRRRRHPRRPRRGLPPRVQPDPPARGHRLEPAQRGAPLPGRPHHPHISNQGNPANSLSGTPLGTPGGDGAGESNIASLKGGPDGLAVPVSDNSAFTAQRLYDLQSPAARAVELANGGPTGWQLHGRQVPDGDGGHPIPTRERDGERCPSVHHGIGRQFTDGQGDVRGDSREAVALQVLVDEPARVADVPSSTRPATLMAPRRKTAHRSANGWTGPPCSQISRLRGQRLHPPPSRGFRQTPAVDSERWPSVAAGQDSEGHPAGLRCSRDAAPVGRRARPPQGGADRRVGQGPPAGRLCSLAAVQGCLVGTSGLSRASRNCPVADMKPAR